MEEKKLLLIGIDSLDPKIIEKLMEEGKLPNFKKLKESGSYEMLDTTTPPETPVAWSAAATGSNPGKYNIYDFINRDKETYLPKLNLAEEKRGILKTNYDCAMKGVPFWSLTSEAGIPTTVMRWPVTFPPSRVNGRMLSGLGVIDIKGYLNSYKFYSSAEFDEEKEGMDKMSKIVKVEKNKTINTNLFGPFMSKRDGITEIKAQMEIKLEDDAAIITVDGKDYKIGVKGWSDWIKVKFDIGVIRSVHGIFKAYLLSTEPEFNMYITSIQIDPVNPMYEISYPGYYSKDLAQEIGLFYTMGMPEDTKAVTDNRISPQIFLEQVKQIEDGRTKMFWHEFGKFKSGVYAFGFDSGDRLKHIFWNNKVLKDKQENRDNEENKFSISKEIEEYYTEKDNFLGQVLGEIDEHTQLIIFSDHGFSSFERAVSINTWLVENDYMTLTREIDEKDAGELFKYVDWSKTRAYSLGFTSIYINLKGRESKGIVNPEDKDRLIKDIIKKLGNLTDPETGKKVCAKLYKGSEIYSGKYKENAPDIVVGFDEGYRMAWQNAVAGFTPWILKDNEEQWTGDHLIESSKVPGILFTNFKINKSSKTSKTKNPSLMDIAPTVLKIFNIPKPESMDGESLI